MSAFDIESESLINKKHSEPAFQKPWGKLLAVFIASCITGGLTPGQAVWVELLAKASVFSSQCKGNPPCKEQELALGGIFTILLLLCVTMFLPAGLLFDDYGGKFVATLGGVLNAIGYILLLVPVIGASQGLDSTTSPIVVLAVLLTELGMVLTSYSLFALMFHFPGHNAFIISLSNASMFACAFIPIGLQYVMYITSCTILHAILIAVAASILACLVLCKFTPDKKDFHLQAQRVTGIALPQVREPGFCSKMRTVNQVLSKHLPEHVGIFFFLLFGCTLYSIYQNVAESIGQGYFHDKDRGQELATFVSFVTGLLGILVGPASGIFIDRCGTELCVCLLFMCSIVSFVFSLWTDWTSVRCAIIFITIYQSVWINVVQKHAVCYIPASRIGIGQGVLVGGLGVLGVVSIIGTLSYMESASAFDGVRNPILLFGILELVVGSFFAPWYYMKGVPPMPVLGPSDDYDIAKAFGCRTLDDAEVVVGMPREHILKALGKGDPQKLRELFDSVSSERLFETITKGSPPLDSPGDDVWNGQAFLAEKIADLKRRRPDAVAESIVALGVADCAKIIDCAARSFCGNPEHAPEPAHDWVLGSKFQGKFNDPLRMEFFEKDMAFTAHITSRFGAVIGLVEGGRVNAVAMCFPPGRLLPRCDFGIVGGSRYQYAFKELGCCPPYFDRKYGNGVRMRNSAILSDMSTHHYYKIHKPHWYVLGFAVRPDCQGQGLGRQLMNVVTGIADLDGLPCFLETSGERNKGVYKRFGYEAVGEHTIEVDDSAFEEECSKPLTVTMELRQPR